MVVRTVCLSLISMFDETNLPRGREYLKEHVSCLTMMFECVLTAGLFLREGIVELNNMMIERIFSQTNALTNTP